MKLLRGSKMLIVNILDPLSNCLLEPYFFGYPFCR